MPTSLPAVRPRWWPLAASVLLVVDTAMLASFGTSPAAARAATAAAALAAVAAVLLWHRQRLQHAVAQARTDPLTGLPNRALADELIAHADRSGSAVTVALIDINGLHMVNGNLGHAAGDHYLQVVADRLRRAVPPGGTLVRQGGDEFTLLAPGRVEPALAERIGAALAGPATIGGYRIQPRISAGIAAAGADTTAGQARSRADSALATAKRHGGNRILVFDAARDPQPSPDGIRPLLRRRDCAPIADGGLLWTPQPGDQLIPVLLSPADLHTITAALADPGVEGPGRNRQRLLHQRLSAIGRDITPATDGDGKASR
ncbi:diguanylate cyclase domain-containing protein [Actinoplanes sp. CA-030573]|uniref:diguanylate cyclase domain-containing protein n=1 Tax=Actinoplanes sp. CA-030573 TaxID=3239898 RepID=UPI003D8D4C08